MPSGHQRHDAALVLRRKWSAHSWCRTTANTLRRQAAKPAVDALLDCEAKPLFAVLHELAWQWPLAQGTWPEDT